MIPSKPTQRLLTALRSKGYDPKPSGEGWSCRCPAHEDRSPSLSIGTGADGHALVKCHAGCQTADVLAAIGLTTRDLMPERDGPRQNGRAESVTASTVYGTPRPDPSNEGFVDVDTGDARETQYSTERDAVAALERRHGPSSALWEYHDAAGERVGIVARWDAENGSKRILPASRNGTGPDAPWVLGGMPTPRPLYGLPELAAAPEGSSVYVTEGEKAADAVRACGLIATTSPHGSNAANTADWSPLAGRDVVILPDHDNAGEKYAADVASLAAKTGARSVRVVRLAKRWSELPKGGDAADVLELEGADSLRKGIESLTADAKPIEPKRPSVGGHAIVKRLADVKPERVSWLWPGRFALGKLTLIAGDPGLGKSFLTLDMAARVSTGRGWPDAEGERFEPGGVVLLSAEDGLADTIRPRLDAAGADVTNIVALEAVRGESDRGIEMERTFDLSTDIKELEDAIQSVKECKLVVIDPVTAYLGGTDSHKNGEIRGLLAPLSALAERHGIAIVAVTHLNKSNGGPAIYRAMGSLAFTAAARAAWSVSKDPDDPARRLLLPIKNNIAPDVGGLAYRIEPVGVDGCPVVSWEPESVDFNADDALSANSKCGGERTERDDAADWLRELLADGPCSSKDVESETKAAGFSMSTVRRAKAAIGVKARKLDFGAGWAWELPEEDAHTKPKMPTPESVSTFAEGDRLRTNPFNGDDWGSL